MADSQSAPVLERSSVVFGCDTIDRDPAIRAAGALLVSQGLAHQDYVEAMIEREEVVSTFMGNGVALPHGTYEAKDAILGTGIVVMQYPDGVEWPNGTAHLVVGLAANSDSHVAILSQLAEVLQDESLCEELWTTTDPEFIYNALTASRD